MSNSFLMVAAGSCLGRAIAKFPRGFSLTLASIGVGSSDEALSTPCRCQPTQTIHLLNLVRVALTKYIWKNFNNDDFPTNWPKIAQLDCYCKKGHLRMRALSDIICKSIMKYCLTSEQTYCN